ncbi:MAG: type II toxin-antitoxin system prevent-host-death family antitoxin [Betaproteobacteria bacterium]
MATLSSRLPSPPGFWALRDAKARFSERVRKVHSEGPQHVTLHGREEFIVVSADEYHRLPGGKTGRHLIDALQASPYRDLDISPERSAMLVRAASL